MQKQLKQQQAINNINIGLIAEKDRELDFHKRQTAHSGDFSSKRKIGDLKAKVQKLNNKLSNIQLRHNKQALKK